MSYVELKIAGNSITTDPDTTNTGAYPNTRYSPTMPPINTAFGTPPLSQESSLMRTPSVPNGTGEDLPVISKVALFESAKRRCI